ncbi:MAG: hypothetical protein CMP53_01605 [Flavobacteriales bacterium]|nr:hypothetical protein [Flavobacteriales bacterium]
MAILMGKNYALINAALFGFFSSLAGFLIVPESHGNGWEYLWITTGTGGFLTAYVFSSFFIVRPKNYSNTRLIFSGVFIGLMSHWTHWYVFLLAQYIRCTWLADFSSECPNPIEALTGAVYLSMGSLILLGWLAIPVAICVLFLTRRIASPSN